MGITVPIKGRPANERPQPKPQPAPPAAPKRDTLHLPKKSK